MIGFVYKLPPHDKELWLWNISINICECSIELHITFIVEENNFIISEEKVRLLLSII